MSAQHTPGPWVLKQFGGPQISGPNGYAVATMWGALSVRELAGQDAANARLIAAAPDLLEALEMMVAVSRSAPGFSAMVRKDAELAIAKARGEA